MPGCSYARPTESRASCWWRPSGYWTRAMCRSRWRVCAKQRPDLASRGRRYRCWLPDICPRPPRSGSSKAAPAMSMRLATCCWLSIVRVCSCATAALSDIPGAGRGGPRHAAWPTGRARGASARRLRTAVQGPELSARARASTGATYRVVDFLDGEGLLERTRYGPIASVEWRRLLRTLEQGLRVRSVEHRRDLPRATRAGHPHCSPGRTAAAGLRGHGLAGGSPGRPYAEPRLAMLYVRDVAEAAEMLGCAAPRVVPTSPWQAENTTSLSSASRRLAGCGWPRSARPRSTC